MSYKDQADRLKRLIKQAKADNDGELAMEYENDLAMLRNSYEYENGLNTSYEEF